MANEIGPKAGDFFTQEEIDEIRAEMVPSGTTKPVRFLYNGQAIQNITTGQLASKGSNVIYHTHYWNFSRETAKKIADKMGVKAVFSE